ncbi:MAG: site-specific integrase [Chloroflexi bacterium]|nr:site-specific integrase [Chloroflexota bacterium]
MTDDKTVLWHEGHMKGGIRQRSPRSWELSIELARDKTTGRRRQKLVTVRGGSYRRAVEVRTRLLAERNAGEFMEPTRMTVADFFERWSRDYVASHVRPMTAEGYESIIRLRLLPAFGRLNLVQLSGNHIMGLYDAMRSRDGRRDGKRGPLSERSIMQTHRVLKQALQHAVKWGLLRHNPADAVEAPRLTQTEMRALSIDETRKVLTLSEGTDIGPLVKVAVCTGMRRSELLGLRWSDVNLELETLTIMRGLHVLRGGQIRYEPPKSKHGRRPVDLSPAAVAALKDHREHITKIAAALELSVTADTPVFVRPDFQPLRPDSVSSAFRRIAEKAGLGRIGIHILRHTHATLMLQQGVHPLVVSRRLGHASVQITLDTYSHVVPSIQRAAAMSFERGVVGEVPGSPNNAVVP